VPVDDMIIAGTEPVAREVIAGICRQLAQGGLIEWMEYPELGHTIGSAKIKLLGIAAVARGCSPDIDLRFSDKIIEPPSPEAYVRALRAGEDRDDRRRTDERERGA
jgi:hypothetical protein